MFSKLTGLVDFAKDFGTSLFTSDVEAAMKILQHIEANNPGVNPIHVEFDDGTVTLRGTAQSRDAAEKAILMAGNVKGVERVEADDLEVEAPTGSASDPQRAENTPAPAVETRVEYYVIERGDTLSAIAKRFYGNAMSYPRIFEANREVIEDADRIYPGQKIRIPID